MKKSMQNNLTYNQFFSQHYDSFYTSKKSYQQESQNLLSIFKSNGLLLGDRILDVGCGTGEHALRIAREGYFVKGIDISPYMIQRAREKSQNVQSVNFSCQSLQEEQEKYAHIYSLFNVINCLPHKAALKTFIHAASRVLNQRGTFVFDCWHAEAIVANPPLHLRDTIELPTEVVNREVVPNFDPTTLHCTLNYHYSFATKTETVVHHLTFFTESTIAAILAECDMKILNILGSINPQKPLTSTDRMSTYIVQKI